MSDETVRPDRGPAAGPITGTGSARPVALTIAGFDPSSGAGITADLKTFAAHQIYGIACISALTVQSTLGTRSVEPLSAVVVRQTLDCLAEDLTVSGIKIGMLGSAAVAAEVASFLRRTAGTRTSEEVHVPVVLDPVLLSSSGAALLDPQGSRVLREELLALVDWVTPNLSELAFLTGRESVCRQEVRDAAFALKEIAARLGNDRLNVVVTGGHMSPPDDFLLDSAGEQVWLSGAMVVTDATHGTGCAFSSALLCRLIAGDAPAHAAFAAKAYVTAALSHAYPIGRGKGPMHHLFELERELDRELDPELDRSRGNRD